MGGFLSRLTDPDFCGKGDSIPNDIFVDFESAKPLPDEEELYNECEDLLATSDKLLNDLNDYQGAGADIKLALEQATSDNERKAWKSVAPRALKVKEFYELAEKLAEMGPRVFKQLCHNRQGTGGAVELLEVHQALVKQFAKIVDYLLLFDNAKMGKPEILNDFSFFRRLRGKMVNADLTPQEQEENPFVFDEETAKMSTELAHDMKLIETMIQKFAHPNPTLNAMNNKLSDFVRTTSEEEAKMTPEMLGTMATVCQKMLDNPDLLNKLKNVATESFILRVLVGLAILYDHVAPEGAFVKGSFVNMRTTVRLICEFPNFDEKLLDSIRYTTKHLNDESTPPRLKKYITTAKVQPLPKRASHIPKALEP